MKSSKIPPVSQSRRSHNFTFSLQRFLLDPPPVLRRLVEVNSEPHTGARPSVRLCVGLINLVSIFRSESIFDFNFIGDDSNLLRLQDDFFKNRSTAKYPEFALLRV